MAPQRYKVLIDSQTQISGILTTADSYSFRDGWMLFHKNFELVAAVPESRVMAIMVAGEDGKFEAAIASNNVEHLSDGVKAAHWRLDELEAIWKRSQETATE